MKFCEDYNLPEGIIEPLHTRIKTNQAAHFGVGHVSSDQMARTEKKLPNKNALARGDEG